MHARKICTMLTGAVIALCGGDDICQAIDDMSGCEFVNSLRDYVARIEYSVAVKRANREPDVLAGIPRDDPDNLVRMIGSDGSEVEIDRFSYNCITCHDGQLARAYRVRLRGNGHPVSGCAGVNASHPIGMDYGSTAVITRKFRSAEGMVFIAGRVGCLSCHDPLNPAPRHLTRSNAESGLCVSCHDR